MSKSFTEFDRPYRRGLVLGLSLAELFLILLFLLLLAAIGMAQNERENNKKLVEENKAQNDLLRQLQNEDGSPISAEDLGELVEGIKSKNKIEEENKILKDNLVSLEEKIKQLKKDIKNEEDKTKDYEKIKNDLLEKKEELEKQIDENNKLNEEVEKLKELEKDKKKLEETKNKLKEVTQKLANTKNKNELLENKNQVLNDNVSNLDNENKKLIEKINIISKKRGQLPDCWYKEVNKKIAKNTFVYDEKEIKIYDVKILDDSEFIVAKHKNPEDKEIIRGNQIPFVSFDAFNRILTKNEFKKYFEPIYLAGQNEKIHSYKCNFTVDIFDYTNKSNKQGYKNSRKFVERYFYKFEENSSWPH